MGLKLEIKEEKAKIMLRTKSTKTSIEAGNTSPKEGRCKDLLKINILTFRIALFSAGLFSGSWNIYDDICRAPLHPQLTTTEYHSSDTLVQGKGVHPTCHHKTCPRPPCKTTAYNTSVAQQTFPTALENLQKCEKAIQEYFSPRTINSSKVGLFSKVIWQLCYHTETCNIRYFVFNCLLLPSFLLNFFLLLTKLIFKTEWLSCFTEENCVPAIHLVL